MHTRWAGHACVLSRQHAEPGVLQCPAADRLHKDVLAISLHSRGSGRVVHCGQRAALWTSESASERGSNHAFWNVPFQPVPWNAIRMCSLQTPRLGYTCILGRRRTTVVVQPKPDTSAAKRPARDKVTSTLPRRTSTENAALCHASLRAGSPDVLAQLHATNAQQHLVPRRSCCHTTGRLGGSARCKPWRYAAPRAVRSRKSRCASAARGAVPRAQVCRPTRTVPSFVFRVAQQSNACQGNGTPKCKSTALQNTSLPAGSHAGYCGSAECIWKQ